MDGWMDEWADGIGIVPRQGRGPSRRAGKAHVPSQVVLLPGPGVVPTYPCIPALGYVPGEGRYLAKVPACPGTLPMYCTCSVPYPSPALASLTCISRRSWHSRHEKGAIAQTIR